MPKRSRPRASSAGVTATGLAATGSPSGPLPVTRASIATGSSRATVPSTGERIAEPS